MELRNVFAANILRTSCFRGIPHVTVVFGFNSQKYVDVVFLFGSTPYLTTETSPGTFHWSFTLTIATNYFLTTILENLF